MLYCTELTSFSSLDSSALYCTELTSFRNLDSSVLFCIAMTSFASLDSSVLYCAELTSFSSLNNSVLWRITLTSFGSLDSSVLYSAALTSFGSLDSSVDETPSATHGVKEELSGGQASKIRVLHKPSGLRPKVVLQKVRQRAILEAEWNASTLNVLLPNTRNHLKEKKNTDCSKGEEIIWQKLLASLIWHQLLDLFLSQAKMF